MSPRLGLRHLPTKPKMKNSSFRRFALALAVGFTGLGSFAFAETVITQSAGTVSEFTPDSLIIRSDVATAPTRYVISRDVSYVDETGAPVSAEIVRSGLPVTVHYVREGDRVLARRVVVHRTATVAPSTTVVERERPVVVERERPVVVERERPVIVEKPPVVVEKRAPAVIEERKTTTTTTVTK